MPLLYNALLMRFLIIGLYLFSSFSLLAEPLPHQHTQVSASLNENRKCDAHLFMPFEGNELDIVFERWGTGVYSMGNLMTMGPAIQKSFYHQKNTAYLTIDKPGLHFDANNPANVRVDKKTYYESLPTDLVHCGVQALKWALKQKRVSKSPNIVLVGHSEGADIALRIYKRILKTEKEITPKIKGLILASLPMNTLEDALKRIVPEATLNLIDNAIQDREDDWLIETIGIPSTYLKSAYQQENAQSVLRKLIALKASAPITVFQGLQDKNTPAKFVKEFEKANAESLELGMPHLNLTAHYYEAGHRLNREAELNMESHLQSLFSYEKTRE